MLHKRNKYERGDEGSTGGGREGDEKTHGNPRALETFKRHCIAMRVMPLCKLSSLGRYSRFRRPCPSPPFKLIFLLRTLRVSLLYNYVSIQAIALLAVQVFRREIEPEYLLILK